jgi:hypothetical protein
MYLTILGIFVVCYIASHYVRAHRSGWTKMAKTYHCEKSYLGDWKGWGFGNIGGVNYRDCLWIGLDGHGLYLKTGPQPFFAAFHPTLLIPWSAIDSCNEEYFQSKRVYAINVKDYQKPIRIETSSLKGDPKHYLGAKFSV